MDKSPTKVELASSGTTSISLIIITSSVESERLADYKINYCLVSQNREPYYETEMLLPAEEILSSLAVPSAMSTLFSVASLAVGWIDSSGSLLRLQA